MSDYKSELTKSAEGYVASFLKGDAFPGGMGYREELMRCNLDFSMESLKRIDALLDHIRTKEAPRIEAFLDSQANVHFVHLIAFYAGKVAGLNAGIEPEWYTRVEAIQIVPQLARLWPDDLIETSVICMYVPEGGGSQQYPPLLSVLVRLFEGDKSVWGSAAAVKIAVTQAAAREAPPKEGMFTKFRRILNSI